jgi:protein-S-isoprenylcysteine O-methyltransferase Ste14
MRFPYLWIPLERDISTMTDAKLAQVDAPTGKNRIADCGVNLWLDWASRAANVIVFGGFASIGVAGLPRLLPLDSILKLLMIAASIANILFLILVALTTITRLVPIQKSKGIEARISALLGPFLSITLASLPKAELGPIWSALSTTLILLGISLSFMVLRWLGKSFSILAEARRLVTEGPYRVVRHPLYLCEGVALAGLTLQVLSPLAVLIAIAIAMVQWRRMINEEAVLKRAFPEYHAYAANTSFLIPTKYRFFTGSNPP